MALTRDDVFFNAFNDHAAKSVEASKLLVEVLEDISKAPALSKRIKELKSLEQQLKDLRLRCSSDRPAEQCGVLSGLAEEAKKSSALSRRGHLKSVHGR